MEGQRASIASGQGGEGLDFISFAAFYSRLALFWPVVKRLPTYEDQVDPITLSGWVWASDSAPGIRNPLLHEIISLSQFDVAIACLTVAIDSPLPLNFNLQGAGDLTVLVLLLQSTVSSPSAHHKLAEILELVVDHTLTHPRDSLNWSTVISRDTDVLRAAARYGCFSLFLANTKRCSILFIPKEAHYALVSC